MTRASQSTVNSWLRARLSSLSAAGNSKKAWSGIPLISVMLNPISSSVTGSGQWKTAGSSFNCRSLANRSNVTVVLEYVLKEAPPHGVAMVKSPVWSRKFERNKPLSVAYHALPVGEPISSFRPSSWKIFIIACWISRNARKTLGVAIPVGKRKNELCRLITCTSDFDAQTQRSKPKLLPQKQIITFVSPNSLKLLCFQNPDGTFYLHCYLLLSCVHQEHKTNSSQYSKCSLCLENGSNLKTTTHGSTICDTCCVKYNFSEKDLAQTNKDMVIKILCLNTFSQQQQSSISSSHNSQPSVKEAMVEQVPKSNKIVL